MRAALKLVPANENRASGSWDRDDYDMVLIETGEDVGRIYARQVPGGGQEWFWALGFPYTLNAWKPFYGVVESKEAAKQAFAERWRAKRI
jgi:hypothetical protein